MSLTPQGIDTIDVHAAGEPGRVILAHDLGIQGDTMRDRLRWCTENLEDLRRLVLHEPRGYPATCAVLVLPPITKSADAGIIIVEQGGFRAMSGSNTICAVTALLETGELPRSEPTTTVHLDTAVGQVEATAKINGPKVSSVRVRNVPSFAVHLDIPLDVPEYGRVEADVAFGGQYFVQAPAASLGVELGPHNAPAATRAAMALLAAAREQVDLPGPATGERPEITLVMLHEPPRREGISGRNSVVLPGAMPQTNDPATWRGTIDRSPCGTGTSARMACLHARGELGLGQPFVHEGTLGTTFTGRLIEEVSIDGRAAVVPTIEGTAWITARTRINLDPTDPFPTGYTLTDIWGAADVPDVPGRH